MVVTMKTGHRHHGFTLIELLVSLTVLGIALGLAAPGMADLMRNNRLVAESDRLLADLRYARSEAVKRRVSVIVCRSADPLDASPVCSGNPNDWATGWIVFASGDTNTTYQSGTDTLLRVARPTEGGITIGVNNAANTHIEFAMDGSLNPSQTGRFAVCDNRGASYGRLVEVSPSGRPRRLPNTAPSSCTNPT